ncbi:MAG: hypothetical protein ACR2JA_13590 [Hydrogenophaga sp.]|uniref:hypothetical protein n=1 Tax=Hydrogenophaga sp. TaxID=1904254 RepID=UPI003D9B6F0F
MSWKTATCNDNPDAWLGDADGVELDGCGLRALGMGLTQTGAQPRARALAQFDHVARIPFAVSDLDTRCVPSLLRHAREGDGFFKTTLLVHLLRLVAVPARMRWVQLESSLLTRGLWDFVRLSGQAFVYPLTEAFIDGRWICTDAYTMDAPLLAAVQRTLDRRGWESGFMAHRAGTGRWDARGDAYQRFDAADPAAMQVQDLGCAHSLADFTRQQPHRFQVTGAMRLAFVSQAGHFNQELGQLRLTQ